MMSDEQPEPRVRCGDCGKLYADFPLDVVLPHDQWAAVSGRSDGGSILCAACIVERAAKLPGVTCVRLSLDGWEGGGPDGR